MALESIGSTDLMLVDSDTASLDAFPTNVVVYDEPLPCEGSGGSTVTEVLVLDHGERFGEGAHDPLDAALRDLTTLIPGTPTPRRWRHAAFSLSRVLRSWQA